jgi:hypothetical protein
MPLFPKSKVSPRLAASPKSIGGLSPRSNVGRRKVACSNLVGLTFALAFCGVHLALFLQHGGVLQSSLHHHLANLQAIDIQYNGRIDYHDEDPYIKMDQRVDWHEPAGWIPENVFSNAMDYMMPFSKVHNGETLEERKSTDSDPATKNVLWVNTWTTTNSSSIPSEHTQQQQQQELDLEHQTTITRLEIESEGPITGIAETNDTRAATIDEPTTANNNPGIDLAETHNNTNNNHVFHRPDDIPPELLRAFDAVLVVGGGTPFSLNDPSILVQRSLDAVIALMSTRNALLPLPDANISILCLSTGQPLAAKGFFPVSRATLSASYLLRNGGEAGVHPDRVYIESSSMDIIGSAFYSRLNFVDPNGWKNILVVVNQVCNQT